MGDGTARLSGQVSVEVFLSATGIALSVSQGCGLEQADALRVESETGRIVALQGTSELPIDLPLLSQAHCQALLDAGRVPVAEFVADGMASGYMVGVIAAN